jgi:hypothetical protein
VGAEADKVARPVHWSSAGLREAITFWLVEKAITFKVSMYKKVEIVKATMYVQEG